MVFYLQSQGIFAWWTFQSDLSSLYTDDIALILENIDVVPMVIRLIQMCSKFTGLQLNVHKMVGYMPHLTTPRMVAGVKISSDLVKYLGVFIERDVAEDKNFDSILDKMKRVAMRWRSRPLTLPVWVLIAKCMIFSVGTHVLNTVTISSHRLEILQKVLNDFLW